MSNADPFAQQQPDTWLNSEQAQGAGQGGYGNGLQVPTGLTDPNGQTIQFGGVAQGLNQANQDAAGQQQTLAQLQQIASGQQAPAATGMLDQQTQQAIAAGASTASSGSGQIGQGASRRQGQMQAGQQLAALGTNAANARAGAQIGAIGQEGALATGIRGQDIGTSQAFDAAAQGQGALNEQGAQLAAQKSQALFGQGMQVAKGAATVIGTAASFSDKRAKQPYADADLKEPGGEAHWTLREEGDFILAINRRTGQMMKLATAPLTAAEKREARAPHGAGPLGANDPRRQRAVMQDGELASPAPPAQSAPQAPYIPAGLAAYPGSPYTQPRATPAFQAPQPTPRNLAAEQLRDPSYDDARLMADMQRATAGGRDAAGNEYAVPGYTPPTVSVPRYNADEAGRMFAEQNTQRGLDRLEYGSKALPPQPATLTPGQVAATTPVAVVPAASTGEGPSSAQRAIGGALLGFGNPQAIAIYASRQPARNAEKTVTPMPKTPPVAVPAPAPAPVATYPDGELGGGGGLTKDAALAVLRGQYGTPPQAMTPARPVAMVSDARAKREAFVDGHRSGAEAMLQNLTMPGNAATLATMPPAVSAGGRVYVMGPHGMVPGEKYSDVPTGDVAVSESQMPARTGWAPPPAPTPTAPPAAAPQPSVLEDAYRYVQRTSDPPQMPAQGPYAAAETTSDARAKAEDGPGKAAADDFLRSLAPHAFTWRDPTLAPNPAAANRPNLGVYAQEVEQTPWGKAIVQPDPATGLRTIDHGAMIGALAAGAGAQKQESDDHDTRIARMEAALGMRGGGLARTREPVSIVRTRMVPTVDPEADGASVVEVEEPWRPPPPTIGQRADAGLAQLAQMRGAALAGVAPRAELARAQAPVAIVPVPVSVASRGGLASLARRGGG